MAQRPDCREQFEIAIICALPLEFNAVTLLFDHFWDEDGDIFGRAVEDSNTYTTGCIGKHNIVLALLSQIGKVNAATTVANMRSSYPGLKLVILAGICGGVPSYGQVEILLGDVIIGSSIVQYDFGRKYPDGFIRKDATQVHQGKADKNASNFLTVLNTDLGRRQLQIKTKTFLGQLQAAASNSSKYTYPGATKDQLFSSTYRHKHHNSLSECICAESNGPTDPICHKALSLSCDDLGCGEEYLVPRQRLNGRDSQELAIHIGPVASGDTVMRSGQDRDRIAAKEGVIAFEMEGAGIYEQLPCIVVKGVCDYADSHKNKTWQDFAAAAAASATKAILERYIQNDRFAGRILETPEDTIKSHFLVPFGRNRSFVGRDATLVTLSERILPSSDIDDCQRTILEGLGGVGKTQIALEALYRVRDADPDCSIFWVSMVDAVSFENAYRNIGKEMKIKGIEEDTADVKKLVKEALSDGNSGGNWLLIIDNADDMTLLLSANGITDYLPFSRKGSILFTTRNHEVAVRLRSLGDDIIAIGEMSQHEGLELLRKGLTEDQTANETSNICLLDLLTNLPLAIRQASAYMAMKQLSTSDYLDICESTNKDLIALLSKDFDDPHRYKEIQNPVITTWLVSFNQISEQDKLAAEYLKFMSLISSKDIPKFLLPATQATKLEIMDAIGTLKAYKFITQREGCQKSFDIHGLVRLALRKWLESQDMLQHYVTWTIQQLGKAFLILQHANKHIWVQYRAHAEASLRLQYHCIDREAVSNLSLCLRFGQYMLGLYRESEHNRYLHITDSVKAGKIPQIPGGGIQSLLGNATDNNFPVSWVQQSRWFGRESRSPSLVYGPRHTFAPSQISPSQADIRSFYYLRTQGIVDIDWLSNNSVWTRELLQGTQVYPIIWHAALTVAEMYQSKKLNGEDLRARNHFAITLLGLDEMLAEYHNMEYDEVEVVLATTILCAIFEDLVQGETINTTFWIQVGLFLFRLARSRFELEQRSTQKAGVFDSEHLFHMFFQLKNQLQPLIPADPIEPLSKVQEE